MRQKCSNEKAEQYKYYGARGITISEDWSNFYVFQNWCVSNGYQEGLTLDRINNDGNYEPSNCRFTTRTVQMRNTRRIRSNNNSGYRGVSLNKQSNLYHVTIALNGKNRYLGRFKDAIDAAKEYDKYILENCLEHTMNFNY